VVDGSILVRNGELTTANVDTIRRDARAAAAAVGSRLGWS
jgi:hypothetical protein